MTLTEFLLARITEDEAIARQHEPFSEDPEADDVWSYIPDAIAQHVFRWNPTRVLAECESKRRVVAMYDRVDDGECPDPCHDETVYQVMMALALAYANHPDYLPEWKP